MAADLTFLFWNLARRPVEGYVAALVKRHAVDVLILAECASPDHITKALNKTWNFLGDGRENPPGTYYRRRGDNVEYFWYLFDQVLVRPDLLKGFFADNVRIITRDGPCNLLTDAGIPDRREKSDHLPLLFRITI